MQVMQDHRCRYSFRIRILQHAECDSLLICKIKELVCDPQVSDLSSKLREMRQYWTQLPVALCSKMASGSTSQDKCWNGITKAKWGGEACSNTSAVCPSVCLSLQVSTKLIRGCTGWGRTWNNLNNRAKPGAKIGLFQSLIPIENYSWINLLAFFQKFLSTFDSNFARHDGSWIMFLHFMHFRLQHSSFSECWCLYPMQSETDVPLHLKTQRISMRRGG